jgi:hypothetical protein
MARTEITRPKYQRNGLRYASDATDAWGTPRSRIGAGSVRSI